MPTTTVASTVLPLIVERDLTPGEPIGDLTFRTIKSWRAIPGAGSPFDEWHVAVCVDIDLEAFQGNPAAQAIIRLRMSDGTTSTPAVIGGGVSRLILGWSPIPADPAETSIILEAKRAFGGSAAESPAVYRAEPLVIDGPSVGLRGGPSYPAGYTAPDVILAWIMGPGVPVGATWTEFNLEVETLTLVGAPAVSSDAITLATGQRIIGTVMPEPGDTFDVELDITTPAVTTTGHRFFTTKVGTSNAAPGVSLRFSDTAGSMILRYTDTNGANTVTAAVPGDLSTRQTLRVRKTATDIELLRDGVVLVSEPRATPLGSGVGGEFTINGFQNGTFDGDITVHGVTIIDGS